MPTSPNMSYNTPTGAPPSQQSPYPNMSYAGQSQAPSGLGGFIPPPSYVGGIGGSFGGTSQTPPTSISGGITVPSGALSGQMATPDLLPKTQMQLAQQSPVSIDAYKLSYKGIDLSGAASVQGTPNISGGLSVPVSGQFGGLSLSGEKAPQLLATAQGRNLQMDISPTGERTLEWVGSQNPLLVSKGAKVSSPFYNPSAAQSTLQQGFGSEEYTGSGILQSVKGGGVEFRPNLSSEQLQSKTQMESRLLSFGYELTPKSTGGLQLSPINVGVGVTPTQTSQPLVKSPYALSFRGVLTGETGNKPPTSFIGQSSAITPPSGMFGTVAQNQTIKRMFLGATPEQATLYTTATPISGTSTLLTGSQAYPSLIPQVSTVTGGAGFGIPEFQKGGVLQGGLISDIYRYDVGKEMAESNVKFVNTLLSPIGGVEDIAKDIIKVPLQASLWTGEQITGAGFEFGKVVASPVVVGGLYAQAVGQDYVRQKIQGRSSTEEERLIRMGDIGNVLPSLVQVPTTIPFLVEPVVEANKQFIPQLTSGGLKIAGGKGITTDIIGGRLGTSLEAGTIPQNINVGYLRASYKGEVLAQKPASIGIGFVNTPESFKYAEYTGKLVGSERPIFASVIKVVEGKPVIGGGAVFSETLSGYTSKETMKTMLGEYSSALDISLGPLGIKKGIAPTPLPEVSTMFDFGGLKLESSYITVKGTPKAGTLTVGRAGAFGGLGFGQSILSDYSSGKEIDIKKAFGAGIGMVGVYGIGEALNVGLPTSVYRATGFDVKGTPISDFAGIKFGEKPSGETFTGSVGGGKPKPPTGSSTIFGEAPKTSSESFGFEISKQRTDVSSSLYLQQIERNTIDYRGFSDVTSLQTRTQVPFGDISLRAERTNSLQRQVQQVRELSRTGEGVTNLVTREYRPIKVIDAREFLPDLFREKINVPDIGGGGDFGIVPIKLEKGDAFIPSTEKRITKQDITDVVKPEEKVHTGEGREEGKEEGKDSSRFLFNFAGSGLPVGMLAPVLAGFGASGTGGGGTTATGRLSFAPASVSDILSTSFIAERAFNSDSSYGFNIKANPKSAPFTIKMKRVRR